MARLDKLPFLNPRRPRSQVGWTMQKMRVVHGWTGKETAAAFGCSPARISRVEQGDQLPTLALVQFYDDTFGGEGLLYSLFQVAAGAAEQDIRRAGGHRPRLTMAAQGDASTFVGDTIPNGTLLRPGQIFLKTWTILNSGTVPWRDRRLERQGPVTGPGLITSPSYVPILDTEPGEPVTIAVPLKAPTYDCSSISYFKMVLPDGRLCFPDNYGLGLEVLIIVRGQQPDNESPVALNEEAL